MDGCGWTDRNLALLNEILNPKPKGLAVKHPDGPWECIACCGRWAVEEESAPPCYCPFCGVSLVRRVPQAATE
jgi:hypothetical protein